MESPDIIFMEVSTKFSICSRDRQGFCEYQDAKITEKRGFHERIAANLIFYLKEKNVKQDNNRGISLN